MKEIKSERVAGKKSRNLLVSLLQITALSLVHSFALLLLPTQTHAQCTLKPGELSGALRLENGVGCVPMTVKAFNTQLDVKDVRYIFEFDGSDESNPTKDVTHTYTTPGSYLLLQLSTVAGKPARSCAVVTVYDTIPPKFSFTACRTRVALTVTGADIPGNYEAYRVEWGDGKQDSVTADKVRNLPHQYSDVSAHKITVHGVRIIANCGGKSSQMFTPTTVSVLPTIQKIAGADPPQTGPQTIMIDIANASSSRYRLQQRRGNSAFQYSNVAATADSRITVLADTGQTCYRLVLADTCIQAQPSPEVCYEVPKPTTTTAVTATTWYLPDAFTPNGDGHNETFGLLGGQPIGNFQFTIYNRWGQAVFATTDPGQHWDAHVNSQPAPAGNYTYHISWDEPPGQRQEKRGTVLLIR